MNYGIEGRLTMRRFPIQVLLNEQFRQLGKFLKTFLTALIPLNDVIHWPRQRVGSNGPQSHAMCKCTIGRRIVKHEPYSMSVFVGEFRRSERFRICVKLKATILSLSRPSSSPFSISAPFSHFTHWQPSGVLCLLVA